MLALLTSRTYLTALLTVIAGVLTALHLIPAAFSDAYLGQAATTIAAITTAVFAHGDVINSAVTPTDAE